MYLVDRETWLEAPRWARLLSRLTETPLRPLVRRIPGVRVVLSRYTWTSAPPRSGLGGK